MIIGISGYARSGKDSLGDVLVEDYGFTKLAFADALRELLAALDPYVLIDTDGAMPENYVPLSVLLNAPTSWEYAKRMSGDTRLYLQRLGEGVRQVIGREAWVTALLTKISPGVNYVVTDVRYIKEADALRDLVGAKIWRLERDGIGPVNDHISEIELDGYRFDRVITMNEYVTAEALRSALHWVVERTTA